ncbi:MAG: phage holin family protein [Alphaproteobacteria bacterium]|nr:phage holin family protein [Alphaproteobacteria bacterium]MDE2341479.1 phage holin family protein [Alphaproteobacteria bacterium]
MPEPAPPTDNASIKATVARLIEDGRAFADAELAYVRTEIDARRELAATGLAGMAAAAILGFAALVALLVGLIFTLAQMIALWQAVLAVTAGALLIAAVLAVWAKGRLGAAVRPFEEHDD